MDSDSVSLLEGSRYLCGNLSPERPRETSHAHPIDAVSSCGSAVEKSGWLFENFSRVLLTKPLRCLTIHSAVSHNPNTLDGCFRSIVRKKHLPWAHVRVISTL